MSPRGLGVMERALPGSGGGRFSSGAAAGPSLAGSPGSPPFPLTGLLRIPLKGGEGRGERQLSLPSPQRREERRIPVPPSRGPPALRGAESDAFIAPLREPDGKVAAKVGGVNDGLAQGSAYLFKEWK